MTGNVNELRKSFAEPIPLEAIADLKLNLPDADLLDPINLSGLRFSNVPNVPLRFTPNVQTPDPPTTEGTIEERAGEEIGDGSGAVLMAEQSLAEVIANEGRRDKVFGTGNPTVQTSITPAELTKAIVDGNQQANQSSGWFDLPRTIAEGVQNVVSAVLTSGVAVGGDGVSFGADAGGLTDAQVEALAASLGEDLDSSFQK